MKKKGDIMLKVLKNLKKSFFSVIIIIALLCLQAAADLALPDYTSKIVNTGIQSGGIETAVPYIIAYMSSNVVFLMIGLKPLGEKLNRVQTKHGIF